MKDYAIVKLFCQNIYPTRIFHYVPLAQLVEHGTSTAKVIRMIPREYTDWKTKYALDKCISIFYIQFHIALLHIVPNNNIKKSL